MVRLTLIVRDERELRNKLLNITTVAPTLCIFYAVVNNTDDTLEVKVELINMNEVYCTKYCYNGHVYNLFDKSQYTNKKVELYHDEVANHQEYLSTDKDEYEIKCNFAISLINEFTDMYNRGTLLCGENVTSDDILSQIIGTIVKTAKLHKLTEEEK